MGDAGQKGSAWKSHCESAGVGGNVVVDAEDVVDVDGDIAMGCGRNDVRPCGIEPDELVEACEK